MSSDYQSAPVDPTSSSVLAAQNLRLGLVDTADASGFDAWLRADSRGFHDTHPADDSLEAQRDGAAYRRTTGVWDETISEPELPVATVSSWPADLTVPGSTSVPAWAISAVTVSPTHRRRGIARALLESELRTANALGLPLAMLTVSEATIYGRYGFAPSVLMADWRIDTRRARWTGPIATGRVHFASPESLRDIAPSIIESTRLDSPGDMERWAALGDRLLGIGPDKDRAKKLRLVRYDDVEGEPQGFAAYTVTESGPDFSSHVLDVQYLAAATDDAYAGLWRYLIEMDLVATITAPLRSVDEAFKWQISDFRAARTTVVVDHLWTRILDVAAALEGRRYSAPGRIVLDVSDDLGFADELVLLEIGADGRASASPLTGEAPEDAAALSLSVADLSAIYLGGVTAAALVRAGRITELRPGSADATDAAFRSPVTPWLSIWF